MALNQSPGTQLQGINVQGIEVNKDHITVNIDYVDNATNLYFDPTDAAVVITKDGNPYTLEKELLPLSRKDDTVGIWTHSFLTTGMVAATYVFTYTGTSPAGTVVTKTLNFQAKEIPIEGYFIGALRTKLWDKRASRYLIDDNMRQRWTDGELYSFCDNARLAISQAPPSPADITWCQAYSEVHEHILTGGFIFALEAAGIFETWNAFQYTDELSLNVNRSVFYQNAQSLRQAWWNAVLMWKRDYTFHRVRGIGLASGKFPLYYTRVLSLLPHMSQTFYG